MLPDDAGCGAMKFRLCTQERGGARRIVEPKIIGQEPITVPLCVQSSGLTVYYISFRRHSDRYESSLSELAQSLVATAMSVTAHWMKPPVVEYKQLYPHVIDN